MGRWINRDPIGERGGINLFCFVVNIPPVLWDFMGFGTLKVFETEIDIDEDAGIGGIGGDERGFEVQYKPEKGECPKPGKIILVQIIKGGGILGSGWHVDAPAAEKERNARTKGGIPIPPYLAKGSRLKGQTDYSYLDSPTTGTGKKKVVALAICRCPRGPDKILKTLYFEFSLDSRKVSGEDYSEPKSNLEAFEKAKTKWEEKGGSLYKGQ